MESVITASKQSLHKLAALVGDCLKAALFVATGCYEVRDCDDMHAKKSIKRKGTCNIEDSCRTFAWRATESSVSFPSSRWSGSATQ